MKKGTILFIHGNSSSSKAFKQILLDKSIAQNMIAIDLPGHGGNHKNYIQNDFSISNMCEFVLKRIQKIDGDILLVGNSLGGHLAIKIASKVHNLKGLVIFGTPPMKKPLNIEEAFLPLSAINTFFTETPTHNDIINVVKSVIYQEKSSTIIIDDFKKTNGKVRIALAKDIAEGNFIDEFEVFTNLSLPKYILEGKNDPTINSNYLRKIKSACNEHCELITIENCGHYISIERPKEFSKIIRKIANEIF